MPLHTVFPVLIAAFLAMMGGLSAGFAQPLEKQSLGQTVPGPSLGFTAPSVADAKKAAVPANAPDHEVSTGKNAAGESVLLITHSWTKYQRPSIQIAWSDAGAAAGVAAPPKPLKVDGAEIAKAWQKQTAGLNQPQFSGGPVVLTSERPFYYDDTKLLTLRGHTNSLHNPSVFGLNNNNQEGSNALLFYGLDAWADRKGAFHLEIGDIDLPSKFTEAGRLRIWFLEEEKVVWAETTNWPGKMAAKPAAIGPQTPDVVPGPVAPTAPDAKQPDKSNPDPAKPIGPQPSTATPVAPPIAQPTPKPAAKPLTIQDMTVDQLANHINTTWSANMSPQVLRFWKGGWHNYYESTNPEHTRRELFMTLLVECHNAQQPGQLRDAFRELYAKLKAQQPASR